MERILSRIGRRTALAVVATLAAALSLVAPTAAHADNAGPRCQNGNNKVEFYISAGWTRTFAPSGLCLMSIGGAKSQFQTDGNLVTRDEHGRATWSSGTANKGATRLVFQTDGNLVIRNGSGVALWSTHTNGRTGVNGTFLRIGGEYGGSTLHIFAVDARSSANVIW